jgi:putative membrane protein
MIRFLLRVILSALGLWFAQQLHLVSFGNFESLAFAGLALGFLNAFVRPILTFLTLPVTILSLGLFLFVLNLAMVFAASWVVKAVAHASHMDLSMHVGSLFHALLITIVVWFVSLVGHILVHWDERGRGGRRVR